MSLVDKLKSRISRKAAGPDKDAVSSAGYEDSSQDPESALYQATEVYGGSGTGASRSSQMIDVPVMGFRTVQEHQRNLFRVLGGSLLFLALVTLYALNQSDKVAQQLGATGQSLMQSQRLAKSVAQAVQGNAEAFTDVKESTEALTKSVMGLKSGDDALNITPLNERYALELRQVTPLVERGDKSAQSVIAQEKMLLEIGAALGQIRGKSAELLDAANAVATLKLQQGAPAAEVAATGQLLMLTQRIGKSASEFMAVEGGSAEALAQLGRDLDTFKDISSGLLSGSTELKLAAAKDAATRAKLEALIKLYEETRAESAALLGNLQGMVAARAAQGLILEDSEPLRRSLQELQGKLSGDAGISGFLLVLLVLAAAVALGSAAGLSYVQLQDSRIREQDADAQRVDAERLQLEAKRVNDANQAAILRLMNELQTVAEGDLTQEATVTEDITGAIADSVNYTVEELRSLVANVQNTASRVAQTTADVDSTSTELLAASNEQLHEIRETGKSVLDMAGRINEVSTQAQESAAVARQSLEAAESGLQAVQNTIGGMNSIRDQIQETSKRIKRLGESSQEIGEITELISDITEQTNVLALNAAIQAASAGEAGRGFSVVAEEVQRLAERSADATRQISALVKAIQTDTQDAIGAMERSTQGVVEGAKLSDNAGTALTEIDRVSRRVADLIEQISNAASREALLANEVAESIQHIFAVTEQTGEGTRVTANQVRELSSMAEELRQSVSRFKIA